MKELVLPSLIEEPQILDDVVDTWTVEGWSELSKKEHGPVFQAGGYPWYDWHGPYQSLASRLMFPLQAYSTISIWEQRRPVLDIPRTWLRA